MPYVKADCTEGHPASERTSPTFYLIKHQEGWKGFLFSGGESIPVFSGEGVLLWSPTPLPLPHGLLSPEIETVSVSSPVTGLGVTRLRIILSLILYYSRSTAWK